MKLLVLLSVVASSSALSRLAASPALRPSISSFRLQGSGNLGLKGGGDSLKGSDGLKGGGGSLKDGFEFPIDAETALKINAAIFCFYGAICVPDFNLPLIDMKMKVHKTRNSLFYNDDSEETESNKNSMRWIGGSFLAIGGLYYIVATETDQKTKKSVCKFATLHMLIKCVILLVNKQPISCGGLPIVSAMGVICAMNGF